MNQRAVSLFALSLALGFAGTIGNVSAQSATAVPFAVDPITVSRTGIAPFLVPEGARPGATTALPLAAAPAATPEPILTAQATTGAPSGAPDETALRYFAQQGDTVRLQREIERLRTLYPNWQPPTDPLATTDYVPDQDIISIWNLVTAGDYAGARAAIAEKQAKDASYVPTTDLLETITRGESSSGLRVASEAADYDKVISIAANAPQLLTCANVDNLWRLAEAFAKTGNNKRAIDAYGYVLSNCTDTAERFATMQKAIELLPRAELTSLLSLEKKDAAGVGEFETIRLDLARRSVAASLEEDGPRATEEDVTLLAAAAESTKNPEDLRLIGYYELARDRARQARDAFQTAFDVDPSAASAEGLGVALLQLNDPTEAEDVLSGFSDESEAINNVYRDAAAAMLAIEPRLSLKDSVLTRVVEATLDERDASLAQELGWYAYAFNQPQTALEWFQTALTWQADLEPAAYGWMVAANALGDTARVEEIRSSWGGRSVRIAQFGKVSGTTTGTTIPLPQPRPAHAPQATQRVAQAQPIAQYRPANTEAAPAPAASSGGSGGGGGGGSCQNFRPAGSLSPGAALTHAWCLMELNRPGQAVEHFARALQSASQSVRSDAAYGQSLAYMRLGLVDDAAVSAAAAPLTSKRAIELQIALLTQKATSAYGIGEWALAIDMLDARSRYAPERNDLLTLRAWSYYHLKRYGEAKRIFEAVAATGYGDALAGLAATRSALQANNN